MSSATAPSVRDQAEILRSRSEAAKAVPRDAQVERYLNPPSATPYGLEYAFHLLGDVKGKTVLDLGCGKGENLMPLLARGANVLGIDLSPELIEIAQRRTSDAEVFVRSAYDTTLLSNSVDAIFCIALIHHLDIPKVREEMRRILKPGGCIILKEPVRFSRTYAYFRSLLPAQEDVSDFEHPLTREELAGMFGDFKVEGLRYFRLPFVPLVMRALHAAVKLSGWRKLLWSLPLLLPVALWMVIGVATLGYWTLPLIFALALWSVAAVASIAFRQPDRALRPAINLSAWLLKFGIGEGYSTEVVARLVKG